MASQQVLPGHRSDGSWGMGSWGDAPAVPMLPQLPNFGELSADPSAPSTPLGSPMNNPMAGGGAYMSYGTAPPMPGPGVPVNGTYCTASPSHCMDQHHAPMGSFSMPPGSPHAACMQPPIGAPAVQAQPVPHLPPWPFGCNGPMQPGAMGVCATVQGPQGNDGSMQFVPYHQSADGSVQFACMPHPGMGQMMSADGSMQFACPQQMMGVPSQGTSGDQSTEATPRPASGSATPIVAAPWQGKAPDVQSSPFPMPLSPPHDLAHAGFSGNQQQAYFENWTPDGQTGSMPASGGTQL